MNEHTLVDVWRHQHERDRKFTYKQLNPIKQARLDFFLVSEEFLGVILFAIEQTMIL